MTAAANMVEVAALVGDTARATMLAALMGGQSLTASELAFLAHVSRPTASEHLAKLARARLIVPTRQGRFSYYRIASPLVASMLESMKLVAALELPPRYQPRSIQDAQMRFARTCYDHLAGQVAVALSDSLAARNFVILSDEGGEVTDVGAQALSQLGVILRRPLRSKRIFCKPCLDWSERRHHIAGHVGAEICRRCLELGWFKRRPDTRTLTLTAAGQTGLFECFGVDVATVDRTPSSVRQSSAA
jgi:DNA-binding transcriptional ArsR family regulator